MGDLGQSSLPEAGDGGVGLLRMSEGFQNVGRGVIRERFPVMRPKCHLVRAAVFSARCLLLPMLWAVAGAADQSPAAQRRYLAEMERIARRLEVGPVVLDRTVVRPGEVLKARATLVSRSPAEILVPSEPGAVPGEAPTLGSEFWYIRRLDGPAQGRERKFRDLLATKVFALKAGEVVKLEYHAGEVDPVRENLESGKYEITVEYKVGPNRIPVGGGSARFTVEGAVQVDPKALLRQEKEKDERAAQLCRKVFAALQVGDILLSAPTVKRGLPLDVTCVVTNPGQRDVEVPAEIAHFGIQRWSIRRLDGGAAADGQDDSPALWSGNLTFTSGKPGVVSPGEQILLSNKLEGSKLEVGSYEITLEVKDACQNPICSRKKRIRVTN